MAAGERLLHGRRDAISALLALCVAPRLVHAAESSPFTRRMREIESGLGGRLGVCIIDTGTGASWQYRGDERFPMCSTFKALLGAAVLARVDAGRDTLERRLVFEGADLVTYSPVTEKHVGGNGLSLAELCEATITTSDNTAANLLLKQVGGPAALTAYLRTLGDRKTRLDRWEPALNEARPGDPRDTTTPAAMSATLRTLLVGEHLAAASLERWTGWLVANQTGDARLRAGLPAGWRVGDKTGTGERGSTNDIGIVWPTGRQPWIVSVFITRTRAELDARNVAIASVGREMAALVPRTPEQR